MLGGAIAARFAVDRGAALDRLVLVDTLGLARFRPKVGFGLTLLALQVRPSERSYERFMRHCSVDLDGLREEMGERWEAHPGLQPRARPLPAREGDAGADAQGRPAADPGRGAGGDRGADQLDLGTPGRGQPPRIAETRRANATAGRCR